MNPPTATSTPLAGQECRFPRAKCFHPYGRPTSANRSRFYLRYNDFVLYTIYICPVYFYTHNLAISSRYSLDRRNFYRFSRKRAKKTTTENYKMEFRLGNPSGSKRRKKKKRLLKIHLTVYRVELFIATIFVSYLFRNSFRRAGVFFS